MTTWKWMAGMRYKRPFYDHYHRASEWAIEHGHTFNEDCQPDWNDPATRGCLLAQVREARGEPTYCPYPIDDGGEVMWVVEKPSTARQTRYHSEADAMLAALRETKDV